MEKGYFTIFIILSILTIHTYTLRDTRCNCPVSTGTVVSGNSFIYLDHLRVSIDGDIKITNQDSYCYDYPLLRQFTNRPNVAVAINKFIAQ